MCKKIILLLLIAMVSGVATVRAQNLSNLKGQAPVSFHGSLGAGMDFYHPNETYPTRDLFAWNVYGNFTPSLYSFSLPFTFVVNQYSKGYTTPFAQFGISPSYRGIAL